MLDQGRITFTWRYGRFLLEPAVISLLFLYVYMLYITIVLHKVSVYKQCFLVMYPHLGMYSCMTDRYSVDRSQYDYAIMKAYKLMIVQNSIYINEG